MCPAAVGAGIVILSLGWTELTDLARANARAQLRLSREGFNAPRILTDWIKRIMDDVRRLWALIVNPRG